MTSKDLVIGGKYSNVSFTNGVFIGKAPGQEYLSFRIGGAIEAVRDTGQEFWLIEPAPKLLLPTPTPTVGLGYYTLMDKPIVEMNMEELRLATEELRKMGTVGAVVRSTKTKTTKRVSVKKEATNWLGDILKAGGITPSKGEEK